MSTNAQSLSLAVVVVTDLTEEEQSMTPHLVGQQMIMCHQQKHSQEEEEAAMEEMATELSTFFKRIGLHSFNLCQ